MNIEDLSKSQLLLLTILVNFVVSIATGILTVALLDKAPATVTQTVNHIVDHTIETIAAPIQVATGKPDKPAAAAPTPDAQLTAAVSADVARSVLIHKEATSTPAIAFGVFLPKSRAVATATTVGLPKEAIIEFGNGVAIPASISKAGATVTIYGFADSAKLPGAPATSLIAAKSLKAGQSIVSLSKDSDALTGIISRVDEAGVHTNLSLIPPGAGVTDLSGAVIGIGSFTPGLILPTDKITTLLTATSTPAGP